MTSIGVIFPPNVPPEQLRSVALAADASGLDELWLWEDCFKESGIACAAAVLAWTTRLHVGIGLLPVPLRNVAITAMELATLERLFPGRVLPGVGHGVLGWMAQVGARAESPMTLLREYTTALRSLLHDETVTTSGRYVSLADVRLDWPPAPPPPLLVGAVRERTVALAGELGDGVILTGETSLQQLRESTRRHREARLAAGREGDGDVVVFVVVQGRPDAPAVAAQVTACAEAGATRVALHSVGDEAPDLAQFARFVAGEVRPLVT